VLCKAVVKAAQKSEDTRRNVYVMSSRPSKEESLANNSGPLLTLFEQKDT